MFFKSTQEPYYIGNKIILNRAKRLLKRRTYMEYHIGEFNTGLCRLPAGPSTCSALTDNDLLN